MKQIRFRPSAGFTLIELLVTMVIVMVLVAISMAGYTRVRVSAHKAVSVSNIRNLSGIVLGSASDNSGRFEGIHGNSVYPYYMTRTFRDTYGVTRQFGYSPANTCWKQDGWDHCGNRDLWDFSATHAVLGYSCWLNDGGWANAGQFVEPDNWLNIKDRVTYKDATGATKVRWLPSRIGEEVAYPILFSDLTRSYNGQQVGNFMKNETEALGTHVGYLDGRIEWVDGKDMKVRYSNGGVQMLW